MFVLIYELCTTMHLSYESQVEFSVTFMIHVVVAIAGFGIQQCSFLKLPMVRTRLLAAHVDQGMSFHVPY